MSEKSPEAPISFQPPPVAAGEIRGDWWSALPVEGRYVLEYISGELAGRLKTIVISEVEYRELANGSLTVEGLITKYGAH